MAAELFMLDADTCISLLRGSSTQLIERLRQYRPEQVLVAAIVAAELHYGAQYSQDMARNLRQTADFLAPLRIVPFDAACAEVYGRVRAALRRSGQLIGGNDMLIAATAISIGATLVTHSTAEFSRVPELRFTDWQSPG